MSNAGQRRQSPLQFSVVMVTHNHRSYIEDALRGIFQQDYAFPFQLVVSDDASIDGSQEIIERVLVDAPGHVEVVFLRTRNRVGGVRNFNRALRSARGQYVVVADGDDVSMPSRLRMLADAIEDNPCSLYVCNAVETDINLRPIGRLRISKRAIQELSGHGVKKMAGNGPIFGAGFAFDARLIEVNGFIDTAYVTNHNVDKAIFWRAAVAKGWRIIPAPSLFYRVHSNGTSIRRRENSARDAGDWSGCFQLYLQRKCNELGNLLYAYEMCRRSGAMSETMALADRAKDYLVRLVRVIDEKLDGCHQGIQRSGLAHDIQSRWFCELERRISRALESLQSIQDILSYEDLLRCIMIAESGILIQEFDRNPEGLFYCGQMGDLHMQQVFLRRLVAFRAKLLKRPQMAKKYAESNDPPSIVAAVLLPRLAEGGLYYDGQLRPLTLNDICTLPARDFLYFVDQLTGFSKKGDAGRKEFLVLLAEGRMTKRRVIKEMAGGILGVVRINWLTLFDRLALIFA